jgi:hypothetical protein
MKYSGVEVNGTEVNGAELMRLINSRDGVLVYRGSTLYFISFVNGKLKVTKLRTSYPALETAIFVAEDFDKIRKLNPSRNYILLFGNSVLQIIDTRTGEVVLILSGYEI